MDPLPRPLQPPDEPPSLTCTNSHIDFNVSAAAWKTSVPAFSASCSAGPEGAAYQRCGILDDEAETHLVSARLLPANSTGAGAHLAVSYEFADPNAE